MAAIKIAPVIRLLQASEDPLRRDLAETLLAWQAANRAAGRPARLGREPSEIFKGEVEKMISRRVQGDAKGFYEVELEKTYEALVDRHPARFPSEIVAKAQDRLFYFRSTEPTADRADFDHWTAELLCHPDMLAEAPPGSAHPGTAKTETQQFLRDPRVAAWVRLQADGCCELCGDAAPFQDDHDQPHLEVHHMVPLARGGSDRVTNAVALCPNCHRAIHHAHDRIDRTERLYRELARLEREFDPETSFAARLGIEEHDFRVVLGRTRIDYDPDKEAQNRKKHGYSLESGVHLLEGVALPLGRPPLLTSDPFREMGEVRHMHLGKDAGTIVFMVTTMRPNETVRVISFREASLKERDIYLRTTG